MQAVFHVEQVWGCAHMPGTSFLRGN
jgi:hypothetical protein